MNSLKEEVLGALDNVTDPCSISAGAPLSVIDMGMVTYVEIDAEGKVEIGMRATSAMCTMIAGIMKVAEDRVGEVDGVRSVEVKLSSGPIWTEADMTDRGRTLLNARRRQSRGEVGVRPHEWKTRLPRPHTRSS